MRQPKAMVGAPMHALGFLGKGHEQITRTAQLLMNCLRSVYRSRVVGFALTCVRKGMAVATRKDLAGQIKDPDTPVASHCGTSKPGPCAAVVAPRPFNPDRV